MKSLKKIKKFQSTTDGKKLIPGLHNFFLNDLIDFPMGFGRVIIQKQKVPGFGI